MRLSSGPMYVADPPSASPVRGSGAAWCRRAFGPLNGGMVHRTVTASTVPACRTPIRPARSATASAPSSAERPRPLPGHVPGGGAFASRSTVDPHLPAGVHVNTSMGDRVRALREFRDITQDELARRSGVSVDTIHKLEQGVRETGDGAGDA
ncbi:Helix-turn-helix domain-containing protein [Streptomyces sp. DpondAA-D4]|nr:Helix-turn-helix domain-containing protein [Streptomyces sp. DpondAA-D4]